MFRCERPSTINFPCVRSIAICILMLFPVIVIVIVIIIPDSQTSTTFILYQASKKVLKTGIQSSYLCDRRNVDRFTPSISLPTNESFDHYRRQVLDPYCDIVPIPSSTYIKPKTYFESDVVFVIFTGVLFYHTRATAQHDTWISRVTNHHYLSATPYPYLPVTAIENAGEDKLSNMKKLFYGLDRIYHEQMQLPSDRRQKWFYIIGCDTFILPHHLLKRLDNLDYRKPYFVGGHWGTHHCLGPKGETTGQADFPSGGAGFFFSMKLLEMMQPHLIDYVENVWPKTSEISDVALACLVKQLGVPLTKEVAFWSHGPRASLSGNGRAKFHAQPEPNDFHYIPPDEMHALDEFYVYQHSDRLIADENWNDLVEFTRRFVISHYSLLRKKKRYCKLPKL